MDYKMISMEIQMSVDYFDRMILWTNIYLKENWFAISPGIRTMDDFTMISNQTWDGLTLPEDFHGWWDLEEYFLWEWSLIQTSQAQELFISEN